MNRIIGLALAGVMTVISGSAFACNLDRRELPRTAHMARIERMERSSPKIAHRREHRFSRRMVREQRLRK